MNKELDLNKQIEEHERKKLIIKKLHEEALETIRKSGFVFFRRNI